MYQVTSAAIIYENLDDEIIIANLDSGVYYSVRNVGVPIWELLLHGYALPKIAQVMEDLYSGFIHVELTDFVSSLCSASILSPVDTTNCTERTTQWPAAYTPPELEIHEELKDILLLDPIHEVDHQGWPISKDV